MQGSNYTDALKAAGLRSPQELIKVWEVNPMAGGPIKRDRLWFYLTYREVYAENTIPGMFFNRNAGDPTKWLVDFDTSRPANSDSLTRNAIGRLTWQATQRNKISVNHSEQYHARTRPAAAPPRERLKHRVCASILPATFRRSPGRRR